MVYTDDLTLDDMQKAHMHGLALFISQTDPEQLSRYFPLMAGMCQDGIWTVGAVDYILRQTEEAHPGLVTDFDLVNCGIIAKGWPGRA